MNSKLPPPPAANDARRPDQALLAAIAELPAELGPPAHLDAAILAASKRALRVRPMERWRPWLSVAAAVFVAFFAANLLQRESPKDSINAVQREQATAPLQDATILQEAAVEPSDDDAADSLGASKFDSLQRAEPAVADSPAAAAAAASPRPGKILGQSEPSTQGTAALRVEPAMEEPAKAEKAARPEPFPAENGQRERRQGRRTTIDEESAQLNRLQSAPTESALAPIRPAAPPAPPPVPLAAPPRAAAPGAPPAISKQAAEASEPAASAAVRSMPSSAPSAASGRAPTATVAPARAKTAEAKAVRTLTHWYAEIRQLAASGKREQAKALLAQLRHAYPRAELPEDLRDLEHE